MSSLLYQIRSQRPLYYGLTVGAGVLTIVGFAIVPEQAYDGDELQALVLYGLIGILAVAAIQTDEETRQQPFTCLSVLCAHMVIGYGLRGLVLVSGHESLALGRVRGQPMDHIREAGLMVLIGFIAFLVGYQSKVPQKLTRLLPFVIFPGTAKRQRKFNRLLIWLHVVYAAGWIGRLLLYRYGVLHFQGEVSIPLGAVAWLNMLANFSTFSVWAVFALMHSRDKGVAYFLPMTLLEFANGLVEGGRSRMLYGPFVYLVTRSLFSKKPISWKQLMAAIAIGVMIVFPFATLVRASYYAVILDRGSGGVREAIESISLWEEEFEEETLAERQYQAKERFAYLDATLIVLDRVPEVYDYQEGRTFLPFVLSAPIPRAFWGEKPISDSTRRNTYLFYDDPNSTEIGTNSYIGVLPELYFNFGWFAFFLMPLVGVWLRFHWERFLIYRRHDPFSAVRYLYIWSIAAPVAALDNLFGSFWRVHFDLYVYYFVVLGVPKLVFLARGKDVLDDGESPPAIPPQNEPRASEG